MWQWKIWIYAEGEFITYFYCVPLVNYQKTPGTTIWENIFGSSKHRTHKSSWCFFYFHPEPWGIRSNLTVAYFSDGLGNQPATRNPRKWFLTWWFKVTFLGWLSDPFKELSDLQLGDEKVTLNHLVIFYCLIFCLGTNYGSSPPQILSKKSHSDWIGLDDTSGGGDFWFHHGFFWGKWI